ncbi:MAG TPA: hypothetical protein VM325_16355 [Alphaproteobacteria bacterium]|nr:hypothetical protein [Alphaproteobacteria bacterium]
MNEAMRLLNGSEMPACAPLRPPSTVMRLERLGAFHQTRLSFMRALLRRLKAEGWEFERPRWDISTDGVGVAVYRARGPARSYSLVCFAHDLDPSLRTDRVIAEAWDATFALYDGTPNVSELARLEANVPLQEAGRFRASDLILSRANRSVRFFEHLVASLAEGRQPDPDMLDSVGYLMRTTAVYGNGKFGLADRDRIADRPEFAGPFRAELLTVWLIRAFTVDLAEHLAAARAPATAARLGRSIRRTLGVGNATGLGLGPFIANHPALFDRWITARETALARVRAQPGASPATAAGFRDALARARVLVASWQIDDARQTARIAGLEEDLKALAVHVEQGALDARSSWDALYAWGEKTLSLEGQEMLVSLLIEPHGALVDDLADTMAIDEAERFRIDATQTVATTIQAIRDFFGWALTIDFDSPDAQARFWYVSEEKLEPRLGERKSERGGEREQPLTIARDVAALHSELEQADADASLAEFLLAYPAQRRAVRRVQIALHHPYSEIHDNLLAAGMVPLDLLRCKLSFFGANRFDPKSDRWLRINMYQHAPYPDELTTTDPDDWAFPPLQRPVTV